MLPSDIKLCVSFVWTVLPIPHLHLAKPHSFFKALWVFPESLPQEAFSEPVRLGQGPLRWPHNAL